MWDLLQRNIQRTEAQKRRGPSTRSPDPAGTKRHAQLHLRGRAVPCFAAPLEETGVATSRVPTSPWRSAQSWAQAASSVPDGQRRGPRIPASVSFGTKASDPFGSTPRTKPLFVGAHAHKVGPTAVK